jgi:hypothetical protein
MTNPNRRLDDLRIASPCKASWDAMTGDDTVRFCGDCKLNVYNLSNMTSAEAASLLEAKEGRVCVRLYRRTDGTVITRDCPVGLRAAMRRATRAASAILTAALGLLSGVAARTAWAGAPQDGNGRRATMGAPVAQEPEPPVEMGKMAVAPRGEEVTVSVADERGASVAGAEVVLTNVDTGEALTAEPDEDGLYRLENVEPGVYALSVTATGYDAPIPKTVHVRRGRPLRLKVAVKGEPTVLMGEVAAPRR